MSDEIQELPDTDNGLDILNIFNEESSSNGLPAGIHERIKLVSIDPKRRKDNNGNLIKKQLFLKFKKFNKSGEDIGEKDVSFFLIDPTKDSAINNLHSFLAQTREILTIFLSEDEIDAAFDPLAVLYDEDNDDRDEEAVAADFDYEVIKKRLLKKAASFTAVENAVCQQFHTILEDKIGFDSVGFRLALEESKDAKYIQIPRFDRFVEKAGISKEASVLYVNEK